MDEDQSNAFPSAALMRRLWAKVEVGLPEECWPFTGYRLKGYGRIGLGAREVGVGYAHRVVAHATHGAPSEGQEARHLCGNAACCNPSHIAWGTPAENQADKLRHGTSNRGERHGMSRLAESDVREIRRRCGEGEYQRDVARAFGIAQQTVSEIVTGKTWGWLDV